MKRCKRRRRFQHINKGQTGVYRWKLWRVGVTARLTVIVRPYWSAFTRWHMVVDWDPSETWAASGAARKPTTTNLKRERPRRRPSWRYGRLSRGTRLQGSLWPYLWTHLATQVSLRETEVLWCQKLRKRAAEILEVNKPRT
jgi:hypothetical protein